MSEFFLHFHLVSSIQVSSYNFFLFFLLDSLIRRTIMFIMILNSVNRAEQSRAEQSRAEQSRAEQSRAEQSRAEQSRAEQSRAEQSRAEQSRAEQSRAELFLISKNRRSIAGAFVFLISEGVFFKGGTK